MTTVAVPSDPPGPTRNPTQVGMWIAVGAIVGLSWAFLVWMAVAMFQMPLSDAVAQPVAWTEALACASGLGRMLSDGSVCAAGDQFMPLTIGYAVMLSIMWVVMMFAMMLPTAVPTLLAYADISFAARAKGETGAATWIFAAGYMIVWGAFGVTLAGLQIVLAEVSMAEGMKAALSPTVGGIVLIVAALYQLSPQKDICLTQCKSPMAFFLRFWKPGRTGALALGLRHGFFCVGCCWALMVLMFVGGTMNVLLMAILTLVMALEKLIPGPWLTRVVATGCLGAGVILLSL